jgi:predicted O-methyltransferase YrrM
MDARIELRIQPALDTLAALLEDGEAGRFDFAFIDADKPSYVDYYEKLLELIRPGGLIAVDNTLALAGAPIVSQDSTSANAMRAFNDYVHHDERVDLALLTVGEGLTLLRVR